MHEGSLVSALLRQVQELAAAEGGGNVAEIRIEVGPLAGVEPLLLHESFRRLRAGTVAASAALIIDTVSLTCRCRDCQLTYRTEVLRFDCPTCGERHVDILAGDAVALHSFTLTQSIEVPTSP